MKTLLAALLLFPLCVFAQTTSVAVIPKGTSNFWKIYEAGAKKAAAELGVELTVRGTRFESDVEAQAQIVDYFREKKVSAIVITPLHKDQLVAPVEKAIADGVHVVVTDSALNSSKISVFIGSNNVQAGEMGGKVLASQLGASFKGDVALLRYLKGSDSTEKREAGAIERLKAGMPGATIVDVYYGGVILGDVKRTADTLLADHPDVKGILTIATISTKGVLKSLQQKGIAGKIAFVGAGSDEEIIAALRKGELSAIVVQNPFEMGYRGVKAAVALVKGEKVEKQFYTDVVLVTAENLDKPEIQTLLNP